MPAWVGVGMFGTVLSGYRCTGTMFPLALAMARILFDLNINARQASLGNNLGVMFSAARRLSSLGNAHL